MIITKEGVLIQKNFSAKEKEKLIFQLIENILHKNWRHGEWRIFSIDNILTFKSKQEIIVYLTVIMIIKTGKSIISNNLYFSSIEVYVLYLSDFSSVISQILFFCMFVNNSEM